jgi:hypothetical protein
MTDATTTRPTHRLVPVALILAVLVPVAGAVLGHITLRQIAQTGSGGRKLALTATIIGWAGTVAWFVFWGALLASMGAMGI